MTKPPGARRGAATDDMPEKASSLAVKNPCSSDA